MTGPLALECYAHAAPIGVPCEPDGTCCARRITRALFVGAGVVGADAAERAEAATRGEPGRAAPAVVDEDVAARSRKERS